MRTFALACLLVATQPAFALCIGYEPGLSNFEPYIVEICINGACEHATETLSCGNMYYESRAYITQAGEYVFVERYGDNLDLPRFEAERSGEDIIGSAFACTDVNTHGRCRFLEQVVDQ